MKKKSFPSKMIPCIIQCLNPGVLANILLYNNTVQQQRKVKQQIHLNYMDVLI